MIIKTHKQAIEELIYHSYPALCTGLIGFLIGYFALHTTSEMALFWQSFIASLVAMIGFYIGHRINQVFLYNDYKIGHELENFCFVILFILTSMIISALLQQNFDLVKPYALIALLILPAIFYCTALARYTISTGHLCFGIIMMALLSGFIPIAVMLFLSKIYFLLPEQVQFLWQKPYLFLVAYRQYLPFISIALALLMLYIVTPFYLRERNLYRESKEKFARFATIIQLFILPIYFCLLPQYTLTDYQNAQHDSYYQLLFLTLSVIVIFGIYSVIIRQRQWLNNANLLTKDIVSPIVLAGIVVFLKLPNMSISSVDIFMGATNLAPISYFSAIMLPDMPVNSDLLSYLPILLAQSLNLLALNLLPLNLLPLNLLGGEADYHALIAFSFILIHTLLIIITFFALSRFLPHLFTFAILFIIPIKFPELLLLISYASLLFDKNLRQSATLWSVIWYFGGCLFLLLSPLYALFFLIGTVPYIIFTFICLYHHHKRHTLNLILFYGFVTIALLFSPSIISLLTDMLAYIAQYWLFDENFMQWGQNLHANNGRFWQIFFYNTIYSLWIIAMMIAFALIIIFSKTLLMFAQSNYHLSHWVIISCGLTLIFSLPVLLNNLMGFDQSMAFNRLIYMFTMFGVPVILFRNGTLFNKSASHLLCALVLLGMCVYSFLIVPEFNALFQF
ncbi:MAG: hypothetical protein K0U45_04225 [Alphaproteobacteria bacterium]|nr:hypothetical protein [Alphaproteobacteria bacterium]